MRIVAYASIPICPDPYLRLVNESLEWACIPDFKDFFCGLEVEFCWRVEQITTTEVFNVEPWLESFIMFIGSTCLVKDVSVDVSLLVMVAIIQLGFVYITCLDFITLHNWTNIVGVGIGYIWKKVCMKLGLGTMSEITYFEAWKTFWYHSYLRLYLELSTCTVLQLRWVFPSKFHGGLWYNVLCD